jgi:hypothetical protein
MAFYPVIKKFEKGKKTVHNKEVTKKPGDIFISIKNYGSKKINHIL